MLELIAVRHGQSEANVAFPKADAENSEESGLTVPDAAVALTPFGRDQSIALGRWLATRPAPEVVIASPYRRALETSRLALSQLSTSDIREPGQDERLRDRELGQLEMLTRAAIRRRFPEEQTRRDWMGDFRYRPPGGESMADVALRLRSFLADRTVRHAGRRVLVVAHDATILMLRLAIEDLTAEQAYAAGPVRNASVTRWVEQHGRLALAEYNTVTHLG